MPDPESTAAIKPGDFALPFQASAPGVVPPVAFLGFCEGAAPLLIGDAIGGYHIRGLRIAISSPVFPLPVQGIQMVLGLFDPAECGDFHLEFIDGKGRLLQDTHFRSSVSRVDQNTGAADPLPGAGQREANRPAALQVMSAYHHRQWVTIAAPLPPPGLFILEPGPVNVVLVRGQTRTLLSILATAHVPPPAFTEQRRMALSAHPRVLQQVRMILECPKCHTALEAHCRLDNDRTKVPVGATWFQDLPDEFVCACGRLKIPLGMVREGLHGLLLDENPHRYSGESAAYTGDYFEFVCQTFERLIDDSEVDEETIHQFLSQHPVVFSQFSAKLMWSKRAILTEAKTDFAVLTGRGDLVLIEIERPQKRLLTGTGQASSETTQAVHQVESWLHLMREHRAAVLRAFDLRAEDVNQVRGLVVIGRDKGLDPEACRTFKARDSGEIQVMTFDDMLRPLKALGPSVFGKPPGSP